jgi:hypothetical protein
MDAVRAVPNTVQNRLKATQKPPAKRNNVRLDTNEKTYNYQERAYA